MRIRPSLLARQTSRLLIVALSVLLFLSTLNACGIAPAQPRSSSASSSQTAAPKPAAPTSASSTTTWTLNGSGAESSLTSTNPPAWGGKLGRGTQPAETSTAVAAPPVDPLDELIKESDLYFSGPLLTEALDYFTAIAGNSEYNGATPIAKWKQNLRISVNGNPSEEDLSALRGLLELLNRLPNLPNFTFDEENPNCFFYFVPTREIPDHIDNYVKNNLGFFSVRWRNHEIYEARIGISTDDTSQKDRSHLILEELTQSLGLFNDSYAYKNSIFQQEHHPTQQLLPLDVALVRLLYDPIVSCGMSASEAVKALRRKYR